METVLIIIGVLLLIGIVIFIYRKITGKKGGIHKLPVRLLGFENIPAVPIDLDELPGTLIKLAKRAGETSQALYGLTETYVIGGTKATGHSFLYGGDEEDVVKNELDNLHKSLKASSVDRELQHEVLKERLEASEHVSISKKENKLKGYSLDDPNQFNMSWTTFAGVKEDGEQHLKSFNKTLTDVTAATEAFWPTIAKHGLAYNLLILEKIRDSNVDDVKGHLGDHWTKEIEAIYNDRLLYVIDLTIYEALTPQSADGFERFTPATFTVLKQDATTKELTPFLISVAGKDGAGKIYFEQGKASDGAWLYALQAAKTSVTVYGVWYGHVYHWHIVTAAMQMTFKNCVPDDHRLAQLLSPQFNYLIPFDDVLLFWWRSVAPPTSIKTGYQFLELINIFAKDRTFFKDDPKDTLEANGIVEKDFSVNTPWDQYPIVGTLLKLWYAAEKYVDVWVDESYADDAGVASDTSLQKWIADSSRPDEGNVQGLPHVDTRFQLKRVLSSLIFRITAHGTSRLNSAANPVLTYVVNYPPCLQTSAIPANNAPIDTQALLEYLPKTGTIGEMVTFYFTFIFSAPYVPFIPLGGIEDDLFFNGGITDVKNRALITFRKRVEEVNQSLNGANTQISQWPLNIET